MANASRRSKQKQETSKKESPTLDKAPANGQVQKVHISLDQAGLFKQLIAANNETQKQIQFALQAAGLSNENIVGGNLDADEPYFDVERIE